MMRVQDFSLDETRIPPQERNPRLKKVEKTDAGTDTLGRAFGWDNATMDHGKIQDVMLIGASGRDLEFIQANQRVRDIIGADYVFNNHKVEGLGTIKTYSSTNEDAIGLLYEDMARKDSLGVSIINDEGLETHRLDMRHLVQLLHIKEFNRRKLGAYRLTEAQIDEKFFSGQKIEVTVTTPDGKKAIVDLKKKCPIDQLYTADEHQPELDFQTYVDKIEEYQLGIQTIVERKEDTSGASWYNHHAENSGLAFSATVRVVDKIRSKDGQLVFEEKELDIPDCIQRAVSRGRGDVGKQPASFLAKSNPHEFMEYSEKDGMGVSVDFKLAQIHRGKIDDFRAHEGGSPRIWGAAIGQQKDESAYVEQKPVDYKDEKGNTVKKQVNVVYIGGENFKGQIFKAMHNTYDLAMKEGRGFELTDDEAADLILTDIIAPWLATNPKDWNMCLAKSIGSKVDFSNLEALQKVGINWGERKKPFCLEIRCLNMGTGKIEPQQFFSLDDLIKYCNDRITKGHVPGVPTKTQIPSFQGLDKAATDAMQDAKLPDDPAAEANKSVETIDAEKLGLYKTILSSALGEKIKPLMDKYRAEGLRALVDPDGAPMYLKDYLKQTLIKLPTSVDTGLQQLTGETDRSKAVEKIFDEMDRFSDQVRTDLCNALGSVASKKGGKPKEPKK